MKKVLGLDLGTNSIGTALLDVNFEEKRGDIIATGSRIIPMSQADIGTFNVVELFQKQPKGQG